VIAETTDLGTRFAKIAVPDERGRYVIPDLPGRITSCGCADMVSSTHPNSQANPAKF
jgi:hypothetical protein